MGLILFRIVWNLLFNTSRIKADDLSFFDPIFYLNGITTNLTIFNIDLMRNA